jgi:putative ABC transport system ATP-binding protein
MRDVSFAYPGQPRAFMVGELSVGRGEAVLLTGESGSGKSTLLGLLCGIFGAKAGSVMVDGRALPLRDQAARDRLRADKIGYVFQSLNLLPYLTAAQNVELAGQFSPERARRAAPSAAGRRGEARRLLATLGIETPNQKASRLSVGQQQRVAAARALFGSPALLVADEPTAALDQRNRDRFLEAMLGAAKKGGAGLLMVSHDESIAAHFDRQIALGSVARWEPAEC